MNPLLQEIETGLEQKLKTEDKAAYDRVVLAGTKVMFSEKTHGKMAEMMDADGELPSKIADGIGRLMQMLYQSSKNTMPLQAVIPASMTLMIRALDYAERGMGEQITPEIVADTAEQTSAAVLQMLGYKPEDIQKLIAGGQPGGEAPQQPAVAR